MHQATARKTHPGGWDALADRTQNWELRTAFSSGPNLGASEQKDSSFFWWPVFHIGLNLLISSAVAGPTLVVLFMIARCPSAITIRKHWKDTGLLLIRPGNYTAHLGPYREVTCRERQAPGVLLLLGSLFIGKFTT